MVDKSVINIVKKIIKTDLITVQRKKYEDSDGYYNVWKVNTNDNTYILKQTSQEEIDAYKSLNGDSVSKYYGFTKYYNKLYILIEYVNGVNLMKANKENLVKVLDSLINIQKKYWNYTGVIGRTYEDNVQKINRRKQYLNDSLLEEVYDCFINEYLNCERTFVHDDFLPFNVVINDNKCVLIDLEFVGVLPYPLSICRLLAHYKDDVNYLFYMSDDDRRFAIKYYYDNFIKYYNISYDKYIKKIKFFMFYEMIEWVFVYNKYNVTKDERFEYYYNNSKKLADELKMEYVC